MQKKIILLLVILSLSPMALALKVPNYNRLQNPSCTCSCDGRIIFQDLKLDDDRLVLWAKEAVRMSFDYGFGNYETALSHASQYFTRSGWDGFIGELIKSKNLDIMLKEKLVVNAIISSPPKIVKKPKGEQDGWEIDVPIVAQYSNSQVKIEKPLIITLEIIQTSPQNQVRGLAIQQFIVAPDLSAQKGA